METKQRHFNHLSFTDRMTIEAGLRVKMPIKQIAETLGVHISTIYREVKRGVCTKKESWHDRYNYETRYRYKKVYSPDIAHQKYCDHLKAKGAPLKIGNDYALANYIEKRIADDGLTVRAVLGEIKRKQMPFSTSISVNTLYSYIEKGVFLRLSLKNLPFQGKRKKAERNERPAKAPRGLSIEKRPADIAERKSFGHWEMDCVCSIKDTKNALLVLTERVTRREIIIPVPDKTTETIVRKLDILEKKFGSRFNKVFKTITVDNGSEFADCKGMEKSCRKKGNRTQFYYCHPYSAYERGTNERMNREIRRKFPKGTDFSKVSPKKVKEVETWLNNYPREVLGYDTPENLFNYYLSCL